MNVSPFRDRRGEIVCIICGYFRVCLRGSPWQKQFRILYSFEGIACISGVGLPDGSGWRAPMNQNSRWDDENYNSQTSDSVVWRQPLSLKGPHDFLLHDACWRLLQKAMDPHPVPLGRLLDVYKSLPRPFFVEWNYGRGGIRQATEYNDYPQRPIADPTGSEIEENPYNIPIMSELLARTRDGSESRVPRPSQDGRESRDCFSRLPWELREAIAMALPTYDALKLRLSSRSFVDIAVSQTFWASRFARGGERDFIFEVREGKQSTDWMLLYRNSSPFHAPLSVKNRIRIWNDISSIKGLFEMRLNGVQSRATEHCEDPCWVWSQVSGYTKDPVVRPRSPPDTHGGCWVFDKERVVIPQSLTHIAFSVIPLETADYVAGLRFISADGDQHLGYQAEGKELFFAVSSSALCGFTVALNHRGIRALQVVCQDGTRSPWFGRPENALITNRLCCAERVVAIEAGLDGYKLVSLSVAEDMRVPPRGPQQLRDEAFWYPAVPPRELCLNKIIGRTPRIQRYEPVSWILFGGLQGELLPHLTMVSVSHTERGSLHSIRFHYNCDGLPDMKIQFDPGPSHESPMYNIERFPIDGQGGETITALSTYVSGERQSINLAILSFEIETNRDRKATFSPVHQTDRGGSHRPLEIRPGDTLVGLYVIQEPRDAVIGMGAISAQ